jgi:hypothetical protein
MVLAVAVAVAVVRLVVFFGLFLRQFRFFPYQIVFHLIQMVQELVVAVVAKAVKVLLAVAVAKGLVVHLLFSHGIMATMAT